MNYQAKKYLLICLTLGCLNLSAYAAPKDFHNGKYLPEYGLIASIEADMVIPKGTTFKVAFDAAKVAEPGALNSTLNSAARFLNMHHEAGVPSESMQLAIVFHGSATFDITNDDAYSEKFDTPENANAALIQALIDKNVRIILCGQSATHHNVKKDDLLPGVEMALSAMTAHALLQQYGYTLNPF